jgi:hypothetical protein
MNNTIERLRKKYIENQKLKEFENIKQIKIIIEEIKNNPIKLNNKNNKRVKHRRFQEETYWDIDFNNNNIIYMNNTITKPLLKKNVSFTLRGGTIYDEIMGIEKTIDTNDIKIFKLSKEEIDKYKYIGAIEAYHILPLKNQKSVCALYCDGSENIKFANCYVITKTNKDTHNINLFYTYIKSYSNNEKILTYNFKKNEYKYILSSDIDSTIHNINLQIINNNGLSDKIFYEYINNLSMFPDRETSCIVNGKIFAYDGKLDEITYKSCLNLRFKIIKHIFENNIDKNNIETHVDINTYNYDTWDTTQRGYFLLKNINTKLINDNEMSNKFQQGLSWKINNNELILYGLLNIHNYDFYIALINYLKPYFII